MNINMNMNKKENFSSSSLVLDKEYLKEYWKEYNYDNIKYPYECPNKNNYKKMYEV